METAVQIKGQADGISIILGRTQDFEAIRSAFVSKIRAARQFFNEAATPVFFKGRKLEPTQEQVLIDIILQETSMDPAYIVSGDMQKPARPQPEAAASKGGANESQTIFYRGGLRSGQSIKYNGSVVILGDVNAGSEVVAAGNVIVQGTLKGMAHAGCGGDTDCFVSAIHLQPTQLRIANLISLVGPAPAGTKANQAQIAYIKDGQVFIGR